MLTPRKWYRQLLRRRILKRGLCVFLLYFFLLRPLLVTPRWTFSDFCVPDQQTQDGWDSSWGRRSILVPDSETTFAGQYVPIPPTRVRINSDGYRGELVAKGPHRTLRIGGFGDSNTFGWGVEESDTFVALLEADLRERSPVSVEVMNFGVPAHNIGSQVFHLERRMDYDMDVVLFALSSYSFNLEPANAIFDRLSVILGNTLLKKYLVYYYVRSVMFEKIFRVN